MVINIKTANLVSNREEFSFKLTFNLFVTLSGATCWSVLQAVLVVSQRGHQFSWGFNITYFSQIVWFM